MFLEGGLGESRFVIIYIFMFSFVFWKILILYISSVNLRISPHYQAYSIKEHIDFK